MKRNSNNFKKLSLTIVSLVCALTVPSAPPSSKSSLAALLLPLATALCSGVTPEWVRDSEEAPEESKSLWEIVQECNGRWRCCT